MNFTLSERGLKPVNDREIAEEFHIVAYEVEREATLYPFREFIRFDGMPSEYQDMILSMVKKLDERGLISRER